jgi:ABC-2 type transport system permease protein
MPIFDQGYRHWEGELAGHAWRWWAITRRGVLAQVKNKWVVLTILSAWMFALVLAVFVILWGLIERQSQLVAPLLSMIARDLPVDVASDPSQIRSLVWTFAFNGFFTAKMFLIMLLVALVGPDLISQDLRFNAMPLYLSRPLRRFDYFLGKGGVIGAYLLAAAIVPVIIAYLVGIGFSVDFEVVRQSLPILLGSLAYGSIVVVSAATLMLALSSLSKNSRHVTALWVGLWIVSALVSEALTAMVQKDWCALFSYTRNLHRLHHALLGTGAAWEKTKALFGGRIDLEPALIIGDTHPWQWSAAVLLGLFGVSVWILATRVKSLDRLR